MNRLLFQSLLAAGLLLSTAVGFSIAQEPKADAKADPKVEAKADVPAPAEPPPAEEPAAPAPPAPFNGADMCWMMVSSALVLMMTLPGLALFYGGLVRKKNVLSVMMQCLFMSGMCSVLWVLVGYSLAFSENGYVPLMKSADGSTTLTLIGGLDLAFLNGVQPELDGAGAKVTPATPPFFALAIPRQLHMIYQMMFFIITPALIVGAFAERMKFSAMAAFMVLWGLLIYCPLAHWVWGP
ncbi:MAG: ammonium transporter, partial [Planctomycetia bacterium]